MLHCIKPTATKINVFKIYSTRNFQDFFNFKWGVKLKALLGYILSESSVNWLCGGSLISEYYILTAAHCVDTPPICALLGEVKYEDIPNSYDDPHLVEIGNKVIHPQYNQTKPYNNDIALLQTRSPVKFDQYVRPACLQAPSRFELMNPSASVIATGWGLTKDGGSVSNELLKVALKVIDKNTCKKYLDQNDSISDERIICAGDLQKPRNTCRGDSGGPLQVVLKLPYCMYGIIGVTSLGANICESQKPSLFTRVSFYQAWIESVVWSKS